MTSTISPEAAAKAAKQILGFYPDIPASDPKAFAAGLVQTLSIFPPAVIERAVSPIHGLASVVSFPNLAEMRKHLDTWRDEHFAQQARIERANRKYLPEPDVDPVVRKRVGDGLRKLSEQIGAGIGPSQITDQPENAS